jgi:hypothetical protein
MRMGDYVVKGGPRFQGIGVSYSVLFERSRNKGGKLAET